VAPPAGGPPAVPPAPRPATATFSAQVNAVVAAARRQLFADSDRVARAAVARARQPAITDGKIEAFRQWQKANGLWRPADEDTTADRAGTPCLYTRLRGYRDAPVTGKYAAAAGGKTQLDQEIDRLKVELPKLRKATTTYAAGGGDVIPQPVAKPAAFFDQVRADAQARRQAVTPGKSLYERLGLTPPRSQR
jgi:hypothetical protein